MSLGKIVNDSRAHEGDVPQKILEMGPGVLSGWQLLASEEAGGHLQLAPSAILSVSLAGNGSATAQRESAISRRRLEEVPLDVRSRTGLR
jgi:hypothetical protein